MVIGWRGSAASVGISWLGERRGGGGFDLDETGVMQVVAVFLRLCRGRGRRVSDFGTDLADVGYPLDALCFLHLRDGCVCLKCGVFLRNEM